MQYLDMPKVASILEKAQGNLRDHLILLLAFTHGLRASEVANLRIQDVSEGHIQVARVKGSNETRHGLIPSQNVLFDEPALLARWLGLREPRTDFLFPSRKGGKLRADSLGKIGAHYMKLAGIEKKLAHIHALKHACCSIQARAGVGIEYIAQYVGHRDLKNTKIYLNISDDESTAHARSAFQKLLEG